MNDPNPYAAPRAEAATKLESVERIPFYGTVSQMLLRGSLRTRFSWGGLAVLTVGSLVCLMSSPSSFLKPWQRPGLLFVDVLGEQLGLIGLGILSIALWHLYASLTGHNIDQRERYLLKDTPSMYTEPKQGWFDEECVYIREGGVDSWVSWHGVGHYQQGQELLLIDWGPGIGGTSVLTSDMFESTIAYRQTGELLAKKTPKSFQLHRLGEFAPHVELDAIHSLLPTEADTIARSQHTTTYREAWRTVSAKIPREIFQHSRPLHYFFVYMAVLALVFVQRWWISFFLLSALWLTIFGLGMLISYVQLSKLFRRGNDRLITTKTLFTREHVHVHSTVAYSKIPLDGFRLIQKNPDQLILQHRDSRSPSELKRADFASAEDWSAACSLFGANDG